MARALNVCVFQHKKLDSRPIWLPLADTLLTNTPKYGSSNIIRMRKLVNDVKFNANSADAEGRC